MFVYDTTLRVPLIVAGPGMPGARRRPRRSAWSTSRRRCWRGCVGAGRIDADGIDLRRHAGRPPSAERDALRRVVRAAARLRLEPAARAARRAAGSSSPRRGPSSTTSAADPGETRDLAAARPSASRATRRSGRAHLAGDAGADAPSIRDRRGALQSLGYVSDRGRPRPPRRDADPEGSPRAGRAHRPGDLRRAARRRARGDAARASWPRIRGNPQAHLRLGYVLARVEPLRARRSRISAAAIAARMPSADPHLGLAGCQAAARRFDAAERDAGGRHCGSSPTTRWCSPTSASCCPTGGQPREAVPLLERALDARPGLPRGPLQPGPGARDSRAARTRRRAVAEELLAAAAADRAAAPAKSSACSPRSSSPPSVIRPSSGRSEDSGTLQPKPIVWIQSLNVTSLTDRSVELP